MTKKLNGRTQWIIVAFAILGFVFNSGILYNHVHELSKKVDKLIATVEKIDERIDEINITLAKGKSP